MKLARYTIFKCLTRIIHIFEMNDITIGWKKLKMFKAEQRGVVEDRPYNREQIKTLVVRARLRDKCVILIMASVGLRREK